MMLFPSYRTRRSGPLTVQSVSRSHIGKVRSVNEDRLLDCPDRNLWAIADGMGGHQLGDRAATIVVRALAQLVGAERPFDGAGIAAALDSANGEIAALARDAGHICGSTVAALHIADRRYTLFWAGDSRVYRLRDRKLQRLTRDHSVVQEMTDAGLITEAQGRNHPQANVITRAVGIERMVQLESATGSVRPGDLFLLCSDGLSALLSDDVLCAMLGTGLDEAAGRLLNAALDSGGRDNISLILVSLT